MLFERRLGLPLSLFAVSKAERDTAMLVGGWLRAKCPDSDSSAQMHISQSRDGSYRGLTHKTFKGLPQIALRKYLERYTQRKIMRRRMWPNVNRSESVNEWTQKTLKDIWCSIYANSCMWYPPGWGRLDQYLWTWAKSKENHRSSRRRCSWQEPLNIQAEGCAAFAGSCLEFLRPNKLNFTTALTWSEPENGPICPENLSAGSHCHFSLSASAELYSTARTTDSCTALLFHLQQTGTETQQWTSFLENWVYCLCHRKIFISKSSHSISDMLCVRSSMELYDVCIEGQFMCLFRLAASRLSLIQPWKRMDVYRFTQCS